MESIVIFCKSYLPDLSRTKNLIQSIELHNIDHIPIYVSVPSSDYLIFRDNFSKSDVILFCDEDITNQLIKEPINEFKIGYINQQIVKLSFWKKNLCENYFCVDSDCMFIRDFRRSDFIADPINNIPYTILVQDKDLWVEPNYRSYYEARLEKLDIIKEKIGLIDTRNCTCHGNTILSRKVLESFEKKFLKFNGLSFPDILKEASYEFSWYNTWLLKDKTIEIIQIEPIFKVFHILDHYSEYVRKNITIMDISKAYLGICMNSNWAKDYGIERYGDKIPSRYELFLRKKFNFFQERLKLGQYDNFIRT